MLEKPNLDNQAVIDCLHNAYGLDVDTLSFLPLGADLNTAVYRADTVDKQSFFVKLRRREFFDPTAVRIPKFLSDQGVSQVIPSIVTQSSRDWADIDSYHLILYPFIGGKNGFEISLSDQQRIEFGKTLKQLHTIPIPAMLASKVPRETFSPKWRNTVQQYLQQVQQQSFSEPIAAQLASVLRENSQTITNLICRTEELVAIIEKSPRPFVLCHADIHAWNLLIEPKQSRLYIVDWDTLIFAPKEKDLMFIGSGLGGNGHTREEETRLFYKGYGPTQIDQATIAYYRYERIIEDIGAYCEQLFLSNDGEEDRVQALAYLKSNFLPNGTIEIARRLDTG